MAIFWFHDLSIFLIKQFKWNETLSNIISFIIIFIVVIFCFRILELILSKITALLLLNWINNLGGALFGFIRGAIIVSVLLFLSNFIPLPKEVKIQMTDSQIARYLMNSIIIIYNSLEEWFPEHFQFEFEVLKEKLYQNINI